MGIFDALRRSTERIVEHQARKLINKAENKLINEAEESLKNHRMITREFTYDAIPRTVEELKAVQKCPQDVFETAALAVLALNVYESDPDACAAMLDYLNGPDAVANRDLQLIRTQFMGDAKYTVRSYFKGAGPQNNYTPTMPYTVTVHDNPYSYQNQQEGYISLFIPSGGADTDRQVTLRTKPSTGEWFIHSWQGLLMGIRTADEANPWA